MGQQIDFAEHGVEIDGDDERPPQAFNHLNAIEPDLLAAKIDGERHLPLHRRTPPKDQEFGPAEY